MKLKMVILISLLVLSYFIPATSSFYQTTNEIYNPGGNTTYVWWVNVTDGITWNNATYYYSTEATVSGHNLRYDVSNDGTINTLDLSTDWAYNTIVGGTYNGFYDVNTDTVVNTLDLSTIWSDNSVGG
jgi:hypothetical protein